MPLGGALSERVLILAPRGRDGEIAATLLREAGWPTLVCADLAQLCIELDGGAAFAVMAEEGLDTGDLRKLARWIKTQPAWSDFPIVLLTGHGDTPERTAMAQRFQDLLGNVSFLERPFHPTTLVSIARSARRSRRRQYRARELLDRYELLARELQHRTKNLMAVIQSIASASLRNGGEGSEAFFARLHALAKAQDLLMETSGNGAGMRDVVAQALESFGSRVSIEGPDVHLKPSAAQGFALIMHELATNAVKHGALTVHGGKVAVRWSIVGNPAEPVILFRWRERGGPPAAPPTTKGFGSILLEHAVASSDHPPQFEYTAEGFTYELRAALAVLPQPRQNETLQVAT